MSPILTLPRFFWVALETAKMKKVAIAFAALFTMVYVTQAWAGCPMGTRYTCVQGFNGKVVCSCS
jgi:hypothetical protein